MAERFQPNKLVAPLDFNNAAWTNAGLVITAAQQGPTSADSTALQDNSAAAAESIVQPVFCTAHRPATASVWVEEVGSSTSVCGLTVLGQTAAGGAVSSTTFLFNPVNGTHLLDQGAASFAQGGVRALPNVDANGWFFAWVTAGWVPTIAKWAIRLHPAFRSDLAAATVEVASQAARNFWMPRLTLGNVTPSVPLR